MKQVVIDQMSGMHKCGWWPYQQKAQCKTRRFGEEKKTLDLDSVCNLKSAIRTRYTPSDQQISNSRQTQCVVLLMRTLHNAI